VQHSALETELNLSGCLPMAAKLTALPLCSAPTRVCAPQNHAEICAQRRTCRADRPHHQVESSQSAVEAIAAQRVLDVNFMWCHQREGKRMCLWTEILQLEGVGTEENPAAYCA
jgi:hypothetical protein